MSHLRLAQPRSLGELAVMRRDTPGGLLVGGGTLTIPSWHASSDPGPLISLSRVTELLVMTPTRIGAAVTLDAVSRYAPAPAALGRVAGEIATPAVRAMATIGGNVVGASPGCLAVVLLALNASAATLSEGGAIRRGPLADHVGRPGRVLVHVEWDTGRQAVAHRALATGLGPVLVTAAVGWDVTGRDAVAVIGGATVPPTRIPLGPEVSRRGGADPDALVGRLNFLPPERRHVAAVLLGRCLAEMEGGMR